MYILIVNTAKLLSKKSKQIDYFLIQLCELEYNVDRNGSTVLLKVVSSRNPHPNPHTLYIL